MYYFLIPSLSGFFGYYYGIPFLLIFAVGVSAVSPAMIELSAPQGLHFAARFVIGDSSFQFHVAVPASKNFS
jgi:hypothetical protein